MLGVFGKIVDGSYQYKRQRVVERLPGCGKHDSILNHVIHQCAYKTWQGLDTSAIGNTCEKKIAQKW